jgi:PPIC-type PPIASE domain
VKWFIVLLLLLGGGLAAAAFAVPTNAAVVNGTAISQETLNSDVSAIAGSADYQCYLNSEEYLTSGGNELPPVTGAGTGQNSGDNPTATTAFVATYLDTEIDHQIVFQLADARHVSVTPADLTAARTTLTDQISSVMEDVTQTAQGENPHFTCSVTGQPVSGEEVLKAMPASFVDQQVQFVATVTALEEDLAGVGSSEADVARYFEAHSAEFDTACFTVATYQSEDAATAAAAQVASGTPFSQVASEAQQGGPQGCSVLSEIVGALPSSAKLGSLATGAVSNPIDDNGTWLLLQITSRTPTPFAKAKASVTTAVQQAGSNATQAALRTIERRSSVSVNPRYGEWAPDQAVVFVPFTPEPSDVLNAPANEVHEASSSSASPSSG